MAAFVSAISIVTSFAYAVLVLYVTFLPSPSFAIDVVPAYPDAIADLKEVIVKGLNFHSEDVVVTGFDPNEALVGHSVAYEFDVEIDNQILPVKLLEDVNKWEHVDLPIFRVQETQPSNGFEPAKQTGPTLPVLAPFQLAGPMEIWIQDAKDMRLSLPHDVDAGVLRKVILAEGAVVTVKGARSVSLINPIKFPLPLNHTQSTFASSLLSLAEQLHQASLTSETPLLSLRIVGPTSLTSPSSSSSSPSRLKLKRLAPGFVHLSSPTKTPPSDALSEINPEETTAVLTPKRFSALWPLASLNVSNQNLMGFEKLLVSVLGKKKGFFRLMKADVSAQTYAKIGFEVEKRVKEGDLLGLPEWRTKPETVKLHFEVLGKVEGKKVIPERIVQIDGFNVEDSFAVNVATGNVTTSTVPLLHPPPNPFTL